MKLKTVIITGVAAACFGAAAYAAAPVRRPAPVSRAVALRSAYDPFLLQRKPAPAPAPVPAAASVPTVAQAAQARALAIRVAVTAVRPPYRPQTRSPYQPPLRGSLGAVAGRAR